MNTNNTMKNQVNNKNKTLPINNQHQLLKENNVVDNYEAKYRNFVEENKKTTQIYNNNLNAYKEEIKNLQNSLEELMKDQRDLVKQFEKNDSSWKLKVEEILEVNKTLKDNNQLLQNKEEDLEFTIREHINKLQIKDHENSALRRNLEDKDYKNNELTNKLSMLRGDLEFSRKDGLRALEKVEDLNKEIEEIKIQNKKLKELINKDENFYADLIQKNKEEVNSKTRVISNLEAKIYEVIISILMNKLGKENMEKQKELDDYIEKNSKLNNTINKLNQLKSEMEYEITLVKVCILFNNLLKYISFTSLYLLFYLIG